MDKCGKQFCMNKYQRVTRQFRAENCLIVFHTEVIEAYIVLNLYTAAAIEFQCCLINLKNISPVITSSGLILRSSLISPFQDC